LESGANENEDEDAEVVERRLKKLARRAKFDAESNKSELEEDDNDKGDGNNPRSQADEPGYADKVSRFCCRQLRYISTVLKLTICFAVEGSAGNYKTEE
jgi:hypothetical protein